MAARSMIGLYVECQRHYQIFTDPKYQERDDRSSWAREKFINLALMSLSRQPLEDRDMQEGVEEMIQGMLEYWLSKIVLRV